MHAFRDRLSQMTESEATDRLDRLLADVQGTPDLDVAVEVLAVLGLDAGRQQTFWRLTWCTLAHARAERAKWVA